MNGAHEDSQSLPRFLIGDSGPESYRVVRPLGAGPGGDVFCCEDMVSGELFVLRRVRLLGSTRAVLRRLANETAVLSKLGDAALPHLRWIEPTDDGILIATDFVRAPTLFAALAGGCALSWTDARSIALGIAHAVQRAHDLGVFHGDLRPGNVFLLDGDSGPRVKVVDFGILPGVAGADRHTLYFAPEQLEGKPIDARTDVFGLGVLMYEMLTGELPFSTSHGRRILAIKHSAAPLRPRFRRPSGEIPLGVEEVVMKALSRDPEQRFGSMRELQEALAPWSSEAPAVTPPPPPRVVSFVRATRETACSKPTLVGVAPIPDPPPTPPTTRATPATNSRTVIGLGPAITLIAARLKAASASANQAQRAWFRMDENDTYQSRYRRVRRVRLLRRLLAVAALAWTVAALVARFR